MSYEIGIVVLSLLCLALGCVSGVFIGQEMALRRDRAPQPVDLSYDPQTGLCGTEKALQRETVEMCGVTWTVMKPCGEFESGDEQ